LAQPEAPGRDRRLKSDRLLDQITITRGENIMTTSKPIPATLIPGDGIGPEITTATLMALDALGAPFVWDRQVAGAAGVAAVGDPLPPECLNSIRKTRLALKGPLETPVGGGYRSANVRLREEFKLYANVRPARTLIPGGRYENIDLALVRENNEGLYMGYEHFIPIGDDPHAVGMATGINTRQGCRRILKFAFDYAIRNGRKKVTVVHKANIMKALTGIFLETARQMYDEEYQGRIAFEECIVDACAMKLVMNPWQFDVIVTTNLFGDILSDEIAGLVGGLGMAPGANIGDQAAIFEAVHGSAPDIAGKGVANPTALMLAAAMMLDHVGRHDLAQRLRSAIDATLNEDKVRTSDLGGHATTLEYASAIAARIKAQG
jgi:isocitrate dehydrogenase (NAD+)